MTTLADRPDTALIVIDLQNGVIANAYRRREVLNVVNALVERARGAGRPVIWVQHTDEDLTADSDAWKIVPELSPASDDLFIRKGYRDSFDDTALEAVLYRLGVGKLIVVGAQTDMCVRSTLHGALVRGYDATLVSDAHTTDDPADTRAASADAVIKHTNYYWARQRSPGRTGAVLASADIDFGSS